MRPFILVELSFISRFRGCGTGFRATYFRKSCSFAFDSSYCSHFHIETTRTEQFSLLNWTIPAVRFENFVKMVIQGKKIYVVGVGMTKVMIIFVFSSDSHCCKDNFQFCLRLIKGREFFLDRAIHRIANLKVHWSVKL